MNKLLDVVEKVTALLGVAICVITGVARIAGSYYLFGVQSMTLFTVGMAMMLVAILLKLHMRG